MEDRLRPGHVADAIRTLRHRREELGLSQEEVGLRIGIADNLVAKWETGRRNPSPQSLWWWAEALGMGLTLSVVSEPAPSPRVRHKLEKRVPRGEEMVDPHARPCNRYIRADAPANPYEP